MSHPLSVADFDGRYHVEPSSDVEIKVVEGGRVILENPFVVTLLGQFLYGPVDTVETSVDVERLRDLRDPERTGYATQLVGEFALKPATRATPRGAPKVRSVRVGNPVASTLTLEKAGAGASLILTSIGKGAWTKSLRARWETAEGKENVYLGFRDDPTLVIVGKNLGPLFSLQYTGGGAATAAYTVVSAVPDQATALTTALGVGAPPGVSPLSIDLTDTIQFPNVSSLIAHINRQPGYSATAAVTDADLSTLSPRAIDAAAGVDILAPASATVGAAIGAAVHWVNANALTIGPVEGVTAARSLVETEQPADMPAWAFLGGGSDAAGVTIADYTDGMTALSNAELPAGLLLLDTSDASIREAAIDWIDAQRALGRQWRAVFGLPSATSDADAISIASAIGRHYIAVVNTSIIDAFDATKTHAPVNLAAIMAGISGGIDAPNDVKSIPVTRRAVRAAGIKESDVRRPDQRAPLIKAGVNTFHVEGGQTLITMAVTTDQGPLRTWRIWEESLILDWIEYSVFVTIKPRMVAWAEPEYIADMKRRIINVMRGWANRSNPVLTAGTDPDTGADVPAWTPPTVTAVNGVTSYSISLGMAGMNHHARMQGTVRKVALSTSVE